MEGAPHEYKEKPGACAECGNSPVNHFTTYCSHTLAVWSSPVTRQKGFLGRWLDRQASKVVPLVDPLIYKFFASLPVTSFSQDPSRAATYRSQVIWEEAVRRGIRMEQMALIGKDTDIYRAEIDGKWFYFQSLPVPPRSGSEDSGWVDDKHLLKEVLALRGVAVPKSASVTTLREARDAFARFQGPVVVKPRAGSRGRHTTVNVRTPHDLERAFESAQQLCRYVAIEEYLEGSVCRGTVVGGKLVGFLQGFPPRVTGDGIASVRDLLARANTEKHERVQVIDFIDEHTRFIARLGHTLDSILPEGVTISLTHRTGRLFGGRTREMLGEEHPKLRAYLERAARVLDVPVVGFDLIIQDPTMDPDTQTWGIIEANSLPYIDLHYLPLEGTPSNPAAAVWDLWKQRA